ncbi:MAG: hypothetical protein ACI84O_000767 [Myxococcota bacterium]|jgi:hypothetical protein
MKVVVAVLCWSLACAVVSAQSRAIDLSVEAGRRALTAGNSAEAYEHFSFALSNGADAARLVPMLIESCADNQDLQTLWVNYLFAAKADDYGRYKDYDNEAISELAVKRAAAFREVSKFRERMQRSKKIGDWLIASWSGELLATMAQHNPSLQKLLPADYTPILEISRDSQSVVARAMVKEMRLARTKRDNGLALKFARCLIGMAAQSGFKDLKGPLPANISREKRQAATVLGEVRREMLDTVYVYTIEELEEMDIDEQRSFTLRHASFENPGVCLSPNKLYRVETSCGYNTLLGTATSIELHHQRLLNFYGKDPFDGRQGTVRIVPESFGLESEGAGFFWVGGFQGGDITTFKFTVGTIPGLGRGLTHELTHRFDGATYGGLPAWLAEGKAVWTGGNYGLMTDEQFVEDYVSFSTLFDVAQKGYGDYKKLSELLSGDIEEYRDNYSAGYALYVYLRFWNGFEDAEDKLFASQLEDYQGSLRNSKVSAMIHFEQYFCDGKDGRPSDLKEFAVDYGKFLRGFYWKELADWTKRFSSSGPGGENAEVVYDEPTWSWLRGRTEPWFGQDQARVAALLLQQVGNKAAAEAYQWALVVDEPSDAVLEDFTRLLTETRQLQAAWCLQHWPRYSSPLRDFASSSADSPLRKNLPATSEWLDALAELSLSSAADKLPVTAAALAADYNLYALEFGLDADRELPFSDLAELQQPPFAQPPMALSAGKWQEHALSGMDKKRSVGMWFSDELLGDLHVGRDKGRTATGTMDRTAFGRTAVVFADGWQQPGRYKISGKVEQSTTFFSGGIVFGWNRRDRNTRLSFSGGDYRYSVGETEEAESNAGLSWSLTSSFVREGAKRGGVSFDKTGTTFSFEIIVDGPSAEIYFDGKLVQRTTLFNGRPIYGRIGFYTTTGAMRVIDAKVQRLDRLARGPYAHAKGWGFDSERLGEFKLRYLIGQPMNDVPLSSSGTGVILFAKTDLEHLQKNLEQFLNNWAIDAPAQGLTILLPNDFDLTTLDQLELEQQPVFAHHNKSADNLEITKSIGGWPSPVLFFADPVGIIRYAKRLRKTRLGLPQDFYKLIREYQDHSRSGFAGAGD